MGNTKFSPKLSEFLSTTLDQLGNSHPEFKAILDMVARKEISEAEAISKMLLLLAEEPDLNDQLVNMFVNMNTAPKQSPGTDLDQHSEGSFTGYVEKRENLFQVNPLYQAAIAERLQFDGDVPELRTGRLILEEGVRPAVAVETDALSAVAIGHAINVEEQKLFEELHQHQEQLSLGLEKELQFLQDHSETGLITTLHTEKLLAKYNAPENDLDHYKRGEIPAPIKVSHMGSELASLDSNQKKEGVWKVLSSTQGRRSALHPITKNVKTSLENKGFQVTSHKDSHFNPWVEVSWSMQMDGKNSMQENFNYVGMASNVLSQKIERIINSDLDQQNNPSPVYLEVNTLDQISDRVFGWTVEIWR